jgi:repressor LexA
MAKRGRGRPCVTALTPLQVMVLKEIEALLARESISPSIRELADRLGKSATSTFKMLRQLEQKGYISQTAGTSRSLQVLRSAPAPEFVSIPLLGKTVTGSPCFSPKNCRGELKIAAPDLGPGRHFAFVMSGESMVDAGICSGDVVIARQQPLAHHKNRVVALLNGKVTVKQLHHRDSEIRLLPENKKFKPIEIGPDDDFRILGKVVSVRKKERRE